MRAFFIIFFLCFVSTIHAQDFPLNFIGHWVGELEWHQAGKSESKKVQMLLEVQPTDSAGKFTWRISYGGDHQDVRPYIIKRVDSTAGHWVIDEQNGIFLDYFWIGKRFTGSFTVLNSTLLNTFWLDGDSLVAEFYTFAAEPRRTSGKGSEDIPYVFSYLMKSSQKAILKRKK